MTDLIDSPESVLRLWRENRILFEAARDTMPPNAVQMARVGIAGTRQMLGLTDWSADDCASILAEIAACEAHLNTLDGGAS